MIRLEETVRELKAHSKLSKVRGLAKGSEVSKPYHLIKADEKIEEQSKMI
jgi:hypothetical protein